ELNAGTYVLANDQILQTIANDDDDNLISIVNPYIITSVDDNERPLIHVLLKDDDNEFRNVNDLIDFISTRDEDDKVEENAVSMQSCEDNNNSEEMPKLESCLADSEKETFLSET